MAGLADLEPGTIFAGRFEIVRPLGEGDRKRTYLARDLKIDRQVAVSLVKPDAALEDPEGTEREAKVLGRIGSHANIVSLYDYEMDSDGCPQYMVFEYLVGGTLGQYLTRTGQQSLDEILRFGRQICRGLSHLHHHGLIHRDVSPENVWLDERATAHLGDFDSAITMGDDVVLRPITTSSFASPEEQDGRRLDARSDLYSLGGVLHFLATGERWPGAPSLLRSRREDLPSSFGDLVADLLAPSPEDRPPDTDHVLERLNQIRRESEIQTLIAAGENDRVEFKSSVYHPYGPLPNGLQMQVDNGSKTLEQVQDDVRKELRKSITKTIAAFLNSDGGTLLIGVSDDGNALGIEPDFKYLGRKKNADGWLLSLRELVEKALGSEVWASIRVSLLQHEGKTVAVVHCPPRASETWHNEVGGERLYIRAANATDSLTGPHLLRYVREHWPVK